MESGNAAFKSTVLNQNAFFIGWKFGPLNNYYVNYVYLTITKLTLTFENNVGFKPKLELLCLKLQPFKPI